MAVSDHLLIYSSNFHLFFTFLSAKFRASGIGLLAPLEIVILSFASFQHQIRDYFGFNNGELVYKVLS